jgi:hypothetical protein
VETLANWVEKKQQRRKKQAKPEQNNDPELGAGNAYILGVLTAVVQNQKYFDLFALSCQSSNGSGRYV